MIVAIFPGDVAGTLLLDSLIFSIFKFSTNTSSNLLFWQVDYEEAMLLWHVDKKDFFLWTVTFASTLFLGIEIGVLVGVSTSLWYMLHLD